MNNFCAIGGRPVTPLDPQYFLGYYEFTKGIDKNFTCGLGHSCFLADRDLLADPKDFNPANYFRCPRMWRPLGPR